MKKLILSLAAILFFITGYSQTNCDKKNLSEVNQVQGVYLFVMSKPVQEYDYLGSTKIKVVWTGNPEEMINITLKKMKKDYPTGDGIIFTTMLMDQGDIIKFKK